MKFSIKEKQSEYQVHIRHMTAISLDNDQLFNNHSGLVRKEHCVYFTSYKHRGICKILVILNSIPGPY